MQNKIVVSEDIFIKAAEEYLIRRLGYSPGYARSHLYEVREELEELAEKINALKTVGAI